MSDYVEIHIEFKDKVISDKDLINFAKLLFKIEKTNFNLEEFKQILKTKFTTGNQKYMSYTNQHRTWLGNYGVLGFSLINKNAYNNAYHNNKQQIILKEHEKITEREFEKYIPLFSELPNDVKVGVSCGSGFADGLGYSLDIIRLIMVFPKYEVDKYGEKNLLSYKKAHRLEKLKNGCVLVWFKEGVLFGSKPNISTGLDIKIDFENYLKKLKK